MRLQAYHGQIAEILITRWAESADEHAEVISYHLTRANELAKALNYLITAGERAAARFANEQAVNYFAQAGQILSTLPGTSDIIRWRLAAGLGDVFRATGQFSDSMAALRAGMALMETGSLNPVLRAGLYRRMGDTTRKQGKFQTAIGYFKAAILLLDESENKENQLEMARVLYGRAWAQLHHGLFEQAR